LACLEGLLAMLIVGSAAALTAITAFLAWVFIQRLRARWRVRQGPETSGKSRTAGEC
jgi:hypothetical protein